MTELIEAFQELDGFEILVADVDVGLQDLDVLPCLGQRGLGRREVGPQRQRAHARRRGVKGPPLVPTQESDEAWS